MKNNLRDKLFVFLILTICLVPLAGFVLCGPSAAGANEVQAAPPKLNTPDGGFNASVLDDAADWFGDGFYMRQELITANSRLLADTLATSSAEDVVLGRSGWLYYGKSLGDYTGEGALSDRDIFCAANNIRLMSEKCAGEGIDFLFTIAPNKNSLYPENMPDYPIVDSTKNADRLMDRLGEMGVSTADMFAAFGSRSETLYFSQDSHWNSRGAALAADTILSGLGRNGNFFSDAFSGSRRHTGDLYRMLYPTAQGGETDPCYDGGLDFTFTGPASEPDSIMLETAGGGSGSLYMFRDSFGNQLYPYMAASFGKAVFSRSAAYNIQNVLESGADTVVVELVERNIRYLLDYPALFQAPELSAPEADRIEGAVNLTVTPADKSRLPGCCLIEGCVEGPVDDDSPVYISTAGRTYEALLLGGGKFSAYVPETPGEDTYVIYRAGGIFLSLPTQNAD